ncbi:MULTISPECIES: NifU family protein [Sphingobacterium]|jgi:Fe-S cluster biogenesis protein NfuA|uniref:NifU family protein n=2 Tax=Sphingobacterium TaxID=28453 RepID=A0ABW5Z1F5_9SPHI|nr:MULTISPECIES: NifU family protein [Sphingobacterium]KKX50772.1 thioredoxin [Sphingobacterium sp. IITKGP-BTPF85]MBB2953590.1 Fe-S cluster biogenesis protein NfuA [Sphingobacterium sp. JUb56]MCS3554846.1 Fe-S cluster biogenesis protein NfuA [Sphingobacterium sp. JUb21]MCW2262764.1 Fe-S cluster biogenesis protein NfuA [Sphingobacterium kitahiroshimense]NJI73716.1 NifU family protein [Sphingobacterium sp. B16(2022)]
MATINVYTESTPNPSTMKFLVNKLLINGSLDYADKDKAQESAFAKELFKFNFVNGVFFASNFVTVTKSEDAEWTDIEALLKDFIKGAVESELAVKPIEHTEDVAFEGSDIEIKIQQVLHDYVRPAVEQDGGAIAYKSFSDGVVTVELRGSCSGCPSSSITLKSGIEGLLKRMVPEVEEVVAESM